MHANLRSFVELLARENDVFTIEAEVDPYLELAEVHRRVIARGGPALLFKRVKGSRYPVVMNLFGTARRIEQAFGAKPEKLVREAVQMAEALLPPRPAELCSIAPSRLKPSSWARVVCAVLLCWKP